MYCLSSLFTRSEPQHNIWHFGGITVDFQTAKRPAYAFGSSNLVLRAADACLNSRIFRWISLGGAHVFVHEMGHAIKYRLMGRKPRVVIMTNSCSGYTYIPLRYYRPWYFPLIRLIEREPPLSSFQNVVVYAAGPLTNMAFSCCQLVMAVALKTYITWPISGILAGGGFIWMTGELLYAITTACRGDGDFGAIAREGILPLTLATAALVGEFALGIWGAQHVKQ